METWLIIVIVVAVVLLFLACCTGIRCFARGGVFREKVSAAGKVVVITGANVGLGKETARQLAMRGAKVYMLCRSEVKANEAISELDKRGVNRSLLNFVRCDLSDFSSIHQCAETLLMREPKIDILLNNAGVMFHPKFELTKDGHELTWQSNYLGHFLLTELLLPAIRKSQDGRIVNLSSIGHKYVSSMDLKEVDDPAFWTATMATYSRSKLAQVMHGRTLTKRLRQAGIKNVLINSCHPGGVRTSLGRVGWWQVLRTLFAPLFWIALKSESEGVQTSIFLALSQRLNGVSGEYFADCKRASPNAWVNNEKACDELYEYSLKAVGLGVSSVTMVERQTSEQALRKRGQK